MHSEDDKPTGYGYGSESGTEGSSSTPAPRARNRTVMLTPEMTGQMRSELGEAGLGRESTRSEFERPRGAGFQNFRGGGASFDSGAYAGFSGLDEDDNDPNDYHFDGNAAAGKNPSQNALGLVEDPYASPFSPSHGGEHAAVGQGAGFGSVAAAPYQKSESTDSYSEGQGFGGFGASVEQNGLTAHLPNQANVPQSEPQQQIAPFHSEQNQGFVQSREPQTATAQPIFVQPTAAQPAGGILHAPESNSKDEKIVWLKDTPLVGFLVSFEKNKNGEVWELRSGRLIVTAEPPSNVSSSNYLYLNHETVSPNHAIMKITRHGEIQLLDQLSEYGTQIKRFGSQESIQLSGDKSTLDHGDIVKFGDRAFHVCIISFEEESKE
jgi:hypothetical protein